MRISASSCSSTSILSVHHRVQLHLTVSYCLLLHLLILVLWIPTVVCFQSLLPSRSSTTWYYRDHHHRYYTSSLPPGHTRLILPSRTTRTKTSLVAPTSSSVAFASSLFPSLSLTQTQTKSTKTWTTIIRTTTTRTRLLEGVDDENYATTAGSVSTYDALVQETSQALKRVSWLSWWSQVILTTISSVILLFARGVLHRTITSTISTATTLPSSLPSMFLSASGLVTSVASIIWTWGSGARLSKRLLKRSSSSSIEKTSTKSPRGSTTTTSRIQAATLLRRAIRVGATLNLVGLLVTLIAAEEIVGTLAIKVLTSPAAYSRMATTTMIGEGGGGGLLQPLDILVVQANTNLLLSHFCSLVLLLYLTDRVHKLDPPSTEDKERKR